MASDRVHTTVQKSLCFAIPKPQSRTPVGDSFQLCNMTQTVELGMGKGKDTSLNLSQVSHIFQYSVYQCFWMARFTFQSSPMKCLLFPDDPESMVGNFPPTPGQ
jgi:hypothetical protein